MRTSIDLEDDAFELDEAELFDGKPNRAEEQVLHAHPSSDNEQGEVISEDDVFDVTDLEQGPGGNNGSAKSTATLLGGLGADVDGEAAGGEVASAARPMAMAQGLGGRPPSQRMAIAQSMPVNMHRSQMGSSVPINIPFLGARAAGGRPMPAPAAPAPPPPAMPATFVPPHQLFSQRDEGMMSLMGESPSAAIKRDRLRHRNAVLKSTGFLEGASLAIPVPGPPNPASFTALRAGGLAQALKVGSPVVQ